MRGVCLVRASTLPQEYIPEISAAVEKAGLKWSQFKQTDNSCKPHPPQESLVEEVPSFPNLPYYWNFVASLAGPRPPAAKARERLVILLDRGQVRQLQNMSCENAGWKDPFECATACK